MPLGALSTVAPSGPWTPIGKPWLAALYLADVGVLDGTGAAIADGVAVGTWQDQSGNNNSAVESVDNDRPLFIASDTRGIAVGVPSLGATNQLQQRGLTTSSLSFSGSYIVAGYKGGAPSVFGTFARLWSGSGGDPQSFVGENGTALWRHDTGSGVTGWTTVASINGAAESATALPLQASVIHATGATLTGPIRLMESSIKGEVWQGLCYAFGFTTGAETVDETDRFVAWLAHRAGIASSLVAGHPYRDSPP